MTIEYRILEADYSHPESDESYNQVWFWPQYYEIYGARKWVHMRQCVGTKQIKFMFWKHFVPIMDTVKFRTCEEAIEYIKDFAGKRDQTIGSITDIQRIK